MSKKLIAPNWGGVLQGKEERTGLIFAASPEGGLRLKPLTSGRAD